jgi:hypothetical protein
MAYIDRTDSFLLLACCRRFSLRRRGTEWEILTDHDQGDNEITFSDDEVQTAIEAGMLEVLDGDVVLGLSALGRQTLTDFEVEQECVFEFHPPCEPETPTVH